MTAECRYCAEPGARHYVGGGVWLCFACWCRLWLGVAPPPVKR